MPDNILIYIICFILLSGISLITGYFVIRKKINADHSKEIEYYKVLAFQDALTKLPNRTAFERETKHIENNYDKYTTLSCMIFDLNFLKITNDTFGHIAGDELIVGTGYCLKKTFDGIGSFFRLGGDEFAVILKDLTEEEVAENVTVLCQNISEYNNTHEYKIDISWGIAFGDKNQDIRKLLKLADERMYENKKIMKALF